MIRAGGGALKAYIDALSPEDRATLKPRRTGKSDNAGYNIRPQIKARVRWHAMIDARPLPAPDAGWRTIDSAPKDGATIEVRAVMRVHHMLGAKFSMMPSGWRPDTPQTEWHLTEWREVAPPSSEQQAAKGDGE
jgi:hypothetical protein